MPRNERTPLVFPILLISVGAILLYSQYHPAWDPWPVLRTYWPLILIFVGLGKIWDATQRRQAVQSGNVSGTAPRAAGAGAAGNNGVSIGSTIAILGFVLVLLALFWHGRTFSQDRHADRSMHHESRTVERQDAKSVNVSLEAGSGQVTVSGGSSHLLDADFSHGHSFSSPQINYKVESGVGQLEITQESDKTVFSSSRNDWDLRFSNDVPLELKLDMGAGEGRFRLHDLQVTDLRLQVGAGHVDLDLTGPRKKDLNVDIQGGVGQATIRLPRDVGVIANATGGIGSVSTNGLKRDGDDYVNDVYGKTPATIHLRVQGGIGAVNMITD